MSATAGRADAIGQGPGRRPREPARRPRPVPLNPARGSGDGGRRPAGWSTPSGRSPSAVGELPAGRPTVSSGQRGVAEPAPRPMAGADLRAVSRASGAGTAAGGFPPRTAMAQSRVGAHAARLGRACVPCGTCAAGPQPTALADMGICRGVLWRSRKWRRWAIPSTSRFANHLCLRKDEAAQIMVEVADRRASHPLRGTPMADPLVIACGQPELGQDLPIQRPHRRANMWRTTPA